jgi:transcription initiation factor TFIID TATA-box-binding protein
MSIDLDRILNKHTTFASYEPEVFPGLIYRILDPKITLLIFVSGKIVITGAKRRQDVEEAFEKIMYVLKDAQKASYPFN